MTPTPPSGPPPTPPVSAWQQPAVRAAAAGDARPKLGTRKLLVRFAIVLGAVLLIAALGAYLADAPEPPPNCPPGTECGGPPPAGETQPSPGTAGAPPAATPAAATPLPATTVGIRMGTPISNRDLGYEFEYSDWWQVDTANSGPAETHLDFLGKNVNATVIVAAVPATEAGAQAYADRWLTTLKDWAPDLIVDDSGKNRILGAEIGFIDGVGRTFAGSRSNAQSGTTPVGVSIVTASDGKTTTAVILVVLDPDRIVGKVWLQYRVRTHVEEILKTFRWGPPA